MPQSSLVSPRTYNSIFFQDSCSTQR